MSAIKSIFSAIKVNEINKRLEVGQGNRPDKAEETIEII